MFRFMKILALLAVLFVLAMGAMMALSGIAAKAGKATSAEAEQFASGTDEQGCLDEAVRRVKDCDGVICSAKVGMFEIRCFTAAKQTVGFCDGVPRLTSEGANEEWMAISFPRARYQQPSFEVPSNGPVVLTLNFRALEATAPVGTNDSAKTSCIFSKGRSAT